MNILIVSQCQKNALKETRRIIDQFAERCGDRTWQTVITKAGLDTLRAMLRKTARKNTAVACYWTHGKNRTDLVWIVGDKSQFNREGRVPTNRSKRDVLRQQDEDGWVYAHSIQIMAALAALLHDIGKATIGFQSKLKQESAVSIGADPYRHEWISLRLFQTMIQGCKTDQEWLVRLRDWVEHAKENPKWYESLIVDEGGRKKNIDYGFSRVPPLAQWLMWLIVTHHRMPFFSGIDYRSMSELADLRKAHQSNYYLMTPSEWYAMDLAPVEGWVCPEHWQTPHPRPANFWIFEQNSFLESSKIWTKAMSRWTQKALSHSPLMALGQTEKCISDPLLLHLSRLCLMVGDHNFSSLSKEESDRVQAVSGGELYANTDRKTNKTKQFLDQHLCGVARFSTRFSRVLTKLNQELPAVSASHKSFTRPTTVPRFQWQNKAYNLSKSLQAETENRGFFGINIASTGCGKTLGNVRIMHALANERRGMRLTIALGLRVLTLQTGHALRDKLQLDDESLAVLVGGSASRTLFELNSSAQEITIKSEGDTLSTYGSESAQDLIAEDEVVVGGAYLNESGLDEQEFGTVISDPKARRLLFSPIVSCTIDHIMQASECLRGGHYIVPMLRLLSADLILDEPDDFNQEDLPALARLVHWAGLLGSRVLLSSATITPDFAAGLMQAYQAGRKIWNAHQGLPEAPILAAWFDENQATYADCMIKHDFELKHNQFCQVRANYLAKQNVRRYAHISELKLPIGREQKEQQYTILAKELLNGAAKLHQEHATQVSNCDKTISIGLIRIANIKNITQIAQAMLALPKDTLSNDYEFHVCCYHARQLLLLRSRLENSLDSILKRDNENSLWERAEIQEAIQHGEGKHHVFIVLGSPVTEVGRDHDYDWAIIEPSSMRSLIQLTGRVWRHRPDKIADKENVFILSSNIKSLMSANLNVGHATFTKPGFEEDPEFLLRTHLSAQLISESQRKHITSIARIVKPELLDAKLKLADLEHAVMESLLNPETSNYVSSYWENGAANYAHSHLQMISPFRLSQRQEDYIALPDEDNQRGFSFKTAEKAWQAPDEVGMNNYDIECHPVPSSENNVHPWLVADYALSLEELTERLNNDSDDKDLIDVALRFATVSLPKNYDDIKPWCFNEWLGFYKNL